MPNDSSTVYVRFSETTKERSVESRSIYQYDHGLTLKVYGLDSLTIGQIHFSNSDTGKALNVLATKDSDGSISASIPDVLLAQDKDIHAFLYFEDESSGRTVRTVRIPITPRAKPEIITLESPSMGTVNQLAQELQSLIDEVEEVKYGATLVLEVNPNDGCLYMSDGMTYSLDINQEDGCLYMHSELVMSGSGN